MQNRIWFMEWYILGSATNPAASAGRLAAMQWDIWQAYRAGSRSIMIHGAKLTAISLLHRVLHHTNGAAAVPKRDLMW